MKLLEGIEGGVAVEVGVWRGDFAKVMLAENPLELYLIDPWIQQPKTTYNDILNLDNITNEANYSFVNERFMKNSNVYIQRRFSHEAVKLFTAVNYVYIDANHSYESALMDMCMWYTLIKKGGVLAGHDYAWTSVRAALDTFVKFTNLKYYEVERGSWRIDL